MIHNPKLSGKFSQNDYKYMMVGMGYVCTRMYKVENGLIRRLCLEYKSGDGFPPSGRLRALTWAVVHGVYWGGWFAGGFAPGSAKGGFSLSDVAAVTGASKGLMNEELGRMCLLGYVERIEFIGSWPKYRATEKFWGLFQRDWFLAVEQRIHEVRKRVYFEEVRKKTRKKKK